MKPSWGKEKKNWSQELPMLLLLQPSPHLHLRVQGGVLADAGAVVGVRRAVEGLWWSRCTRIHPGGNFVGVPIDSVSRMKPEDWLISCDGPLLWLSLESHISIKSVFQNICRPPLCSCHQYISMSDSSSWLRGKPWYDLAHKFPRDLLLAPWLKPLSSSNGPVHRPCTDHFMRHSPCGDILQPVLSSAISGVCNVNVCHIYNKFSGKS